MKVSPKLFGHNLECTRRVGYGGLYAEMIQNGKFHAGTEGFYPVEERHERLGRCSERIHLRAGHTYELCVLGGEKTRLRLCEVLQQCETKVVKCGSITDLEMLKQNLATNCIPFETCSMDHTDYESFLNERRKLMAQKIKAYYYCL